VSKEWTLLSSKKKIEWEGHDRNTSFRINKI